MLLSLLAIALGATLGAWMRWGLSLWLNPLNNHFSWGTLTANLIGGYAIGVVLTWLSSHPSVSPEWRLFIVTGLLGGLTTFSSFSAETMQLISRQQYGLALGAIAAHVLGSLVMTGLGMITVPAIRSILS